jgi:tetratricopeptide (TPR) repeat protein
VAHRSLALAEALGDNQQRHRTLHTLGELERHADRLDSAAELLSESVEMARSTGDLPSATFALHSLGDVRLLRGELDAAAARYEEALSLSRELVGLDVESTAPLYAFERATIYCLAGLAAVAARLGEIERAGRLWGAVGRLEAELDLPMLADERAPYEATLAELSGPEFEAALSTGRALTLEQAAGEALHHS